jgi:hypothetical protein
MKPASPTRPGGRDIPAARQQPEGKPPETPNADMQADDAGSSDSGTAATRAMKQTSKTAAESGGKKR